MRLRGAFLCGAVMLSAAAARGQVALVAQERTITAATTADGTTVTQAAPDFAPFAQAISLSAAFATPTGTALNTADTTINCTVDPNAVRARGLLAGVGGVTVVGGAPSPIYGESMALILVTFDVTVATPFHLTASPRPSENPRDEFTIRLTNLATSHAVFELGRRDPAQQVNVFGVLQPGRYSVQYQVELSGATAPVNSNYSFGFEVLPNGPPACLADITGVGGGGGSPSAPDGVVTGDDFEAFINAFVSEDPLADVCGIGGPPEPPDGLVNGDDFIAFIAAFSGGCP